MQGLDGGGNGDVLVDAVDEETDGQVVGVANTDQPAVEGTHLD